MWGSFANNFTVMIAIFTATPGGKNDNNGVNKIAWTGTSSLLVLFASLVLA